MFIQSTSKHLTPPHSPPYHDDLHPVDPRWFALRAGHRKEKVIVKQLDYLGIENCLPLRDRPYRYTSKSGVRRIPLLPGYVFVRIVTRQATAAQSLNFVFGFVKIGRERRQIKAHEIELLRKLSSDTDLDWVVEDKLQLLEHGTPVEINRGPLAGVKGHYLYRKSKNTFVISFAGLDTQLVFEVSPNDVLPLTPATIRS